ncbi:Putative sensor domain protein (fragment) [uncultured Sporomusa sp.]|uniref:Putative sensor domain protein n=1 Tax=uncultured Sporomusa sp. TaxID=307249 RepID=A0A212M003_9FIRM
MQDRKKLKVSALNDYGAYLKKERSFLRDIRLGDKTRAETNLNSLLTYLFTKTVGDKTEIRVRVIELATLVSRAAVEGGADAEHVMAMLKEFNKEVEKFEQVEQFFCRIQTLVVEFLGDSLSMADKKHLSLVNDAKRFIVENHPKPIKIEDVAAHLFISASHLSRLFQRELNCTVNDYITRVRVERAVELMKQPELNVEQVSKAIGFQNQSYFAKFFRRYIGVTPLVYRNSLF